MKHVINPCYHHVYHNTLKKAPAIRGLFVHHDTSHNKYLKTRVA